MIPGLQNNWVIISILIPGATFYGVFRLIAQVLNIHNPILVSIDSNVIFTTAIIVGCGIVNQLFGMAIERAAFSFWNKKDCGYWNMNKAKCPPENNSDDEFCKHVYWQNRYEIMGLYFKSNETDERMIAQFFMAHNISIGFSILLIGVLLYSFTHQISVSVYHEVLLIALLIVFTAFSFIASLIRFRSVVKFLYVFAKVNDIPCCNIEKHFDTLVVKCNEYNLRGNAQTENIQKVDKSAGGIKGNLGDGGDGGEGEDAVPASLVNLQDQKDQEKTVDLLKISINQKFPKSNTIPEKLISRNY